MDGTEKKTESGCLGCGWVLIVPLGCAIALVLLAALVTLLMILSSNLHG